MPAWIASWSRSASGVSDQTPEHRKHHWRARRLLPVHPGVRAGPHPRVGRPERAPAVLLAEIAGDRVRFPHGEVVLDQRGHESHRVHREIVLLAVPAEPAADVDLLVLESHLVGRPQRLHHVGRGAASEDSHHGGSSVRDCGECRPVPTASVPKHMSFRSPMHEPSSSSRGCRTARTSAIRKSREVGTKAEAVAPALPKRNRSIECVRLSLREFHRFAKRRHGDGRSSHVERKSGRAGVLDRTERACEASGTERACEASGTEAQVKLKPCSTRRMKNCLRSRRSASRIRARSRESVELSHWLRAIVEGVPGAR